MSTVSVLTFAFGVVFAAFVEADDPVYPFVANHTCPNKTWVAEPFGFGTYDAPNALLRPEGTSPYVLRLQDRIYAGQTVFIDGKIAENPGDTSFNLMAGIVDLDDNDGEVALHWTQQYSKGESFVTAKVNGQFESDVLYTDLLAVNEEFKIAIRVLEDCFEIYKNGIKVGNYTHRVPIDIIDHIVIIGDVEINALRVVGRQFPRPFRPIFHGTHLMLNDRIRIEARTFDWFFFSLLEKNQNEIAFELFVDIPAKRVRRNSRINGTWGVPEADGPWYFPTEGYIFVLEIVNMEEHLSLMVNGNVYGTFKHRVQNPKEDYVVFEHYIEIRQLPRLDDQTCPKSAWLPVGDGFRFEEDHSAPLIPERTPTTDHNFHYVYSHALNFGQTLYFSGTPELRTSKEFELNIIATSDVTSDDAVRILHIKYSLQRDVLAYNTYTFENDWGDEESNTPSPIKKGESFDLQIHVTLEAFDISVNGTLVHTYKHRLPPNIMCFIRVLGDVTLSRARVAGRQFELPYKVILPSSGLELGDHVVVVGAVTKGEFKINFLNTKDEIVIQFVVRIDDKAIDYNTFKHGKLFNTQLGEGFPIEAGREFEFDFMILPDKNGVAVHIDGVFYETFKHAMQSETSKEEFYYFQVIDDVDFRALQICPHKK